MMKPHNVIMFLSLGLANQGSDFNVSSVVPGILSPGAAN
jgi:hypothetical protein